MADKSKVRGLQAIREQQLAVVAISLTGRCNTAQCKVCHDTLKIAQKDEFEPFTVWNKDKTRRITVKTNKQALLRFAEEHYIKHVE